MSLLQLKNSSYAINVAKVFRQRKLSNAISTGCDSRLALETYFHIFTMTKHSHLFVLGHWVQVNTSNSNAPFFSRTNRTFCPILSSVWFVEILPIVRGPFSRSMSATTYGLSFSNPLGGYRMIVYVAIFPFSEKRVSLSSPSHRGQPMARNISRQPHFGHW